MARRVKVAVVGSGLAGLTAAYLLTRSSKEQDEAELEVHLFEKAPSLGMDSSSVSLPVPGSEETWRIDVPMRSFQGGYYPQLIALYNRLGVTFRKANFSYSFSFLSAPCYSQNRSIITTMIYNGASGRAGVSMPSLLDNAYQGSKDRGGVIRAVTGAWTFCIFVLSTMHITTCYLRLIFYALPVWRSKRLERMSFRDWAEETMPRSFLARWTGMDAAWEDFTHTILLSLFSAVCTAPTEDVFEHPVEEFLDYIWLTLGTHHYVVLNGVQDVATRLASTIHHIHLSSPISAVRPDPQNPHLASIQCDSSPEASLHHGFHHIIFATQAIHAIPLLTSYKSSLPPESPKRHLVEKQVCCLQSFKYCTTIVANHTDATLLPIDPRDRRDLNLVFSDLTKSSNYSAHIIQEVQETPTILPSSYTMATHILSPPGWYPNHLPAVYQTTNPIIPPRNDSVLSIAKLERAVVTTKSKEALRGLYQEDVRQWWQCASQAKSRLGFLQGAGRLSGEEGPGLWFCGSFAHAGIPLLEGCVVSAKNVVEQGIWKCEGLVQRNLPS